MNQLSPEQILEAQKASVDALAGLTSKAFEGFEKLLALNLQTMKAALSETNETARKALSIKNPQEWVALQIELLKPATDKALAYRLQFLKLPRQRVPSSTRQLKRTMTQTSAGCSVSLTARRAPGQRSPPGNR
ncbi:phasin family protein [Cupriavidus sp. D39]|uniref:phasin family protein n=1 Tax=Cupriavidus sp. D39 TaxID=2997877 RepID=UPI00227229CA|nr:phasin family protein [Cupriavidus sp. D39]MCY0854683.1 phasin family protein [Cupriavidus sp. D39]